MPGSAPGRKGVKIETRSLIENNKDNDMRYVYMALLRTWVHGATRRY
jgi:hypothetical protein